MTIMFWFTVWHLGQGMANDDIQLAIVDENLVITDDDDKQGDDAEHDAAHDAADRSNAIRW